MVGSRLVESLEAQHRGIAATAEEIDRALADDDVRRVGLGLHSLKRQLFAHLELEDSRLYPEFSRLAAESDRSLPMDIVGLFSKNIESVSSALKAFLERHTDLNELSLAEFRNDWPLLRRMLFDRIDNEESTLYPLFRVWTSKFSSNVAVDLRSRAETLRSALLEMVDSRHLKSAPAKLRIEAEEMILTLKMFEHLAEQPRILRAAEEIVEATQVWLRQAGRATG